MDLRHGGLDQNVLRYHASFLEKIQKFEKRYHILNEDQLFPVEKY